MKKLTFILSLILSFNAYAANTCGDDLDNNCWDCGKTASDNCTARLDADTKKLTIIGDGYMADFYGTYLSDPSFPVRPWGNDIESVEMSGGIKSIGEYAFFRTQITDITIPASVEKIGMGGVQSIKGLTSVTFEENSQLKHIGSGAFNSNQNLTSINLPEGVEQMDTNVFNGSAIENLILPDSIWSVPDVASEKAPYVHGAQTRAFSGVPNIYCSEASRSKCEEYFNNPNMGFYWQGAIYPIKEKATLYINNNDGSVDTYQWASDGSFAIYRDGNLKTYKGKRIYTLDEANRVTKPTGNTVRIKYR